MGLVWTIALNGAFGLAGYGVARFGFRQPAGPPRVFASVLLAWTWGILGVELLGSIGLLARLPLLLWGVLGLAIAFAFRQLGPAESASRVASEPFDWPWECKVCLGLALWGVGVFLNSALFFPVKVTTDGPIYHLYFAARWWKAGRVFLIAAPFGENAATYFPAAGDLWFTWLMVGWRGERLAKAGQFPFYVVAALAAYALARRLGAERMPAFVATSWFALLTYSLMFSFEANVDMISVAQYLVAVYFLLRDAQGDDRGPSLVLGCLAAGGVMATKVIGVVFVPPLLALAGFGVLLRAGTWARKARSLVVLLTVPLVLPGYWFLQNALLTGNPLYPLRVAAFGVTLLRGWYGPGVMRLSHHYIAVTNWRAFVDMFGGMLDPRLAPLWLVSAAGAWTWGLSRNAVPARRWIALCAGLAVADVILYWVAIPYRTQQRFMLPALGVSVVPIAMTLQRRRWLCSVTTVLLGIHLVTPQGWPIVGSSGSVPWDLSPLVPNIFPSPVFLPHNLEQLRVYTATVGNVVSLLGQIAVGLVAIGVAWAWLSAGRSIRRRGLALGLSVAWAGLLVVSTGSLSVDSRLAFYPFFPDYFAGWTQLEMRAGPSGARVAYAGTNLPFYLLGAGLRNEVRYINVDAHRDWLMHDYHRAAGYTTWQTPRPGWDRVHPDYDAWLANLRAERIQLLVVTRAVAQEGRHNIADSEGFPIERQWADAHPEIFEPLYGKVEADREFRLYRVLPLNRQSRPAT